MLPESEKRVRLVVRVLGVVLRHHVGRRGDRNQSRRPAAQNTPADKCRDDPSQKRDEGRNRGYSLPGRFLPGQGSHRNPLERYRRFVRGRSEEDDHDGPPDGGPFRDGEDCTGRPG